MLAELHKYRGPRFPGGRSQKRSPANLEGQMAFRALGGAGAFLLRADALTPALRSSFQTPGEQQQCSRQS
jgi:hypothetical protein